MGQVGWPLFFVKASAKGQDIAAPDLSVSMEESFVHRCIQHILCSRKENCAGCEEEGGQWEEGFI